MSLEVIIKNQVYTAPTGNSTQYQESFFNPVNYLDRISVLSNDLSARTISIDLRRIEADEVSTVVSGHAKQRTLNSIELETASIRKIPHELASYALFGGSDVHIRHNTIPSGRIYTPDFVAQTDDTMVTIELKTANCWVSAHSMFVNAMTAYNWQDWGYAGTFSTLGVGVTRNHAAYSPCLSNLNFELAIKAYSLGIAILDALELPSGDAPRKKLPLPKISLPLSDPDKLVITMEMLEHQRTVVPKPFISFLVAAPHKHQTKDIVDLTLGELTPFHRCHTFKTTLPDFSHKPHVTGLLGELMPSMINCIMSGQNSYHELRLSVGNYISQERDLVVKRGLWAKIIFPELGKTSTFTHTQHTTRTDESIYSATRLMGLQISNYPSLKRECVDYDEVSRKKTFSPWYSTTGTQDWFNAFEPQATDLDPDTFDLQGREAPYKSFKRELWFQSLLFNEAVISELLVNENKFAQKKHRGFNICKIPGFPACLAIQSCGINNHVYYYLLVSGLPVLGQMGITTQENWSYTALPLTTNSKKISQHLSLVERLMSLRCYWNDHPHLRTDSKALFCMSLYIALDSKQKTVDLAQYARYYFMEMTTAEWANPLKIIEKLSPPFRTQVSAFVAGMLMRAAQISDESGILLNWVTLTPKLNLASMVDLSYMHYVCPSSTMDPMRSLIECLKKLLEMEVLLKPERLDYIGWKEHAEFCEIGPHEFPVGTVVDFGKNLKNFLKTLTSVTSVIETFKEEIAAVKWDDFASFKKTTNMSCDSDSKREFCFKSVLRMMQQYPKDTPFSYLAEFHKTWSEDELQKVVTIFKKDQATGMREIFVLPMIMRMCIKFLEIFARVVNRFLPNEMLSSPSDKLRRSDEHKVKVMRRKVELIREKTRTTKCYVLEKTLVTSADMKTWCQQFCMSNFFALLNGLLGGEGAEAESLLQTFGAILNMITLKEIKIDNRLESWFQDNVAESTNSTFNLLSEILNSETHPLRTKYGIKNRSNMMQGIPHETSSMLHATYQLVVNQKIRVFITEFARAHNLEVDIISTNKVSSDDGSTISTLLFVLDEASMSEVPVIDSLFTLLHRKLEPLKRICGIEVNWVKSTIGSIGGEEEFNSMWYLNGNLIPATVKMVTAPFTMGYHPDLIGRVTEAQSASLGLLKEGVSLSHIYLMAHLTQRFHERALLLHRSPNSVTIMKLHTCQEPSFGYYPILPEGLQGVFPFRYVCALMKERGMLTEYGKLENSSLDDVADYNPKKVSFSLDSVQKYLNLLNELSISRADLCTILDNRWEEFLCGDLSPDLAIKMKVLSPGSRIALSNVNLSKVFRSSCYSTSKFVITHQDFPSTPEWLTEKLKLDSEALLHPKNKNKPMRLKYSRTHAKLRIQDALEWYLTLPFKTFIPMEETNLKRALMNIIGNNFNECSYDRVAKRTLHHKDPWSERDEEIHVKRVLASKWFPKQQYHVREATLMWQIVKSHFPFLRDTLRETLTDTIDSLALMNLCSLTINKRSIVRALTPTWSNSDPEEMIAHLWKHNYKSTRSLCVKPMSRDEVTDRERLTCVVSAELTNAFIYLREGPKELCHIWKSMLINAGHKILSAGLSPEYAMMRTELLILATMKSMTKLKASNMIDLLPLLRILKPQLVINTFTAGTCNRRLTLTVADKVYCAQEDHQMVSKFLPRVAVIDTLKVQLFSLNMAYDIKDHLYKVTYTGQALLSHRLIYAPDDVFCNTLKAYHNIGNPFIAMLITGTFGFLRNDLIERTIDQLSNYVAQKVLNLVPECYRPKVKEGMCNIVRSSGSIEKLIARVEIIDDSVAEDFGLENYLDYPVPSTTEGITQMLNSLLQGDDTSSTADEPACGPTLEDLLQKYDIDNYDAIMGCLDAMLIPEHLQNWKPCKHAWLICMSERRLQLARAQTDYSQPNFASELPEVVVQPYEEDFPTLAETFGENLDAP